MIKSLKIVFPYNFSGVRNQTKQMKQKKEKRKKSYIVLKFEINHALLHNRKLN